MKEYTKDWYIAKQTKDCPLCSFTMKLEAKEDTHRNIKYIYECTYIKCQNKEEVWNSLEA